MLISISNGMVFLSMRNLRRFIYREFHRPGSSLRFKAIDLHALEPTHENSTQLYIAESFAEFLVSLFISSENLRIQHEKWLTAFRRAAEKGQ